MTSPRHLENNNFFNTRIEVNAKDIFKEQKYHELNSEDEKLKPFIEHSRPGFIYSLEGYKFPHAIVRNSKAHGKKVYFMDLSYPYYQGPLSTIYQVKNTYIFNDFLKVKPTQELFKFCRTKNTLLKTLENAIREYQITNINAPYLKMRSPFLVKVGEGFDAGVILRMKDLNDPQTNDGANLFDVIKVTQKKPDLQLSDFILSINKAIDICQSIIRIHANGYVHADLKEANIFMVGEKIYVLDFGLTNKIGEKNEVMGSPLYLSPARFEVGIKQRKYLQAQNRPCNVAFSHTYEIKDDDAGLAKTLMHLLLGESKESSAREDNIEVSSETADDPTLYLYEELDKLHGINFRDYSNPYRLRDDWYQRICECLEKLKRSEIELSGVLESLNQLLVDALALSEQLILYANDLLECIQHSFWWIDGKHVLGKRIAAQTAHESFNELKDAEKFLLEMHSVCKEKCNKEVKQDCLYGVTKVLNMFGTFSALLCGGKVNPSSAQIKTFLQLLGNDDDRLGANYFQRCSDVLQEYILAIPALQKPLYEPDLRKCSKQK